MSKDKNLVEEAIIQMKNLEETVAENAKGILASTMGQEIKELVKESLSEAEEDEQEEIDTEVDMDMDMDDESSDEEDSLEMDDMDIIVIIYHSLSVIKHRWLEVIKEKLCLIIVREYNSRHPVIKTSILC